MSLQKCFLKIFGKLLISLSNFPPAGINIILFLSLILFNKDKIGTKKNIYLFQMSIKLSSYFFFKKKKHKVLKKEISLFLKLNVFKTLT